MPEPHPVQRAETLIAILFIVTGVARELRETPNMTEYTHDASGVTAQITDDVPTDMPHGSRRVSIPFALIEPELAQRMLADLGFMSIIEPPRGESTHSTVHVLVPPVTATPST